MLTLGAYLGLGCGGAAEDGGAADAAEADGGAGGADLAGRDGGAGAGGADAAPHGADAGPADTLPLEIGVGPGPFAPAAPGATALLQRGCQGAQHLTLSVYGVGLAPGEHRVTLALTRAADGLLVVPPYTLALDWNPARAGAQLLGLTLVVFDPLPVIGAEADVQVRVQAADGRTGSATLRVQVEWGPDAC